MGFYLIVYIVILLFVIGLLGWGAYNSVASIICNERCCLLFKCLFAICICWDLLDLRYMVLCLLVHCFDLLTWSVCLVCIICDVIYVFAYVLTVMCYLMVVRLFALMMDRVLDFDLIWFIDLLCLSFDLSWIRVYLFVIVDLLVCLVALD